MRVTTSPGMSRIIEKTMTLTRKSVGMASATRRRTYCFTCGAGSLVQPRVEEARAEPVAVVVLETLHVRLMGDVLRLYGQEDVVGLVGHVALDLVDDLL